MPSPAPLQVHFPRLENWIQIYKIYKYIMVLYLCLWGVILYIHKRQSLHCRQLPQPQHPSDAPQPQPDSTLSPRLCFPPQPAHIPAFMQPAWMVDQENACARKQCSYFGFSPPPTPANLFFRQIARGSSWPPVRGASSRDVPEHSAGRGQSGTAHFGNTLSCSFYGGMVLESQLDSSSQR